MTRLRPAVAGLRLGRRMTN